MKSEKKKQGKNKVNHKNKSGKSNASQLRSFVFSLILLLLAFAFVAGFRYFLKGQTYDGPVIALFSSEQVDVNKFVEDEDFEYSYIMIKGLSEKDSFCETSKPGKKDKDPVILKNGDILEVDKKGSYHNKIYYLLKDGNYVEGDESKVEEIKEYLPLKGYIAITYISSSGVRERTWIDYHSDDNIDKSVYVGDRVSVKAMVTTADGESAFQTEDGLYITTDSSYFTDYTNLAQLTESSGEMTTEPDSELEDASGSE